MWACFDRGVPSFAHLADHDASDDLTYCVRVDQVGELAKLAYYAAKLIKTIRTSPVPPPAP